MAEPVDRPDHDRPDQDRPDQDRPDQDRPDREHRRPDGVDDATVSALGKLSEALETVEHARGLLYGFHRLTGRADITLGEAIDELDAAGHGEVASRLREDLLGRNVLAGRWTFQVVEDYDDNYWGRFREHERSAREQLAQGRRHLLEADMKEAERTRGRRGHEATPDGAGNPGGGPTVPPP